jgi:hypothetical protein
MQMKKIKPEAEARRILFRCDESFLCVLRFGDNDRLMRAI